VPAREPEAVPEALADRARRRLYEAVRALPEATAGELAARLHVGRTLVVHHLARLVEAGLVEKLAPQPAPGRRGRPPHRYRVRPAAVTPGRSGPRYELLARVLLAGLAGPDAADAARARVLEAARRSGRDLGGRTRNDSESDSSHAALVAMQRLLGSLGYRPQTSGMCLSSRSCPFEELRDQDRDAVCSVNLALHEGYLEGLRISALLRARLHPTARRCCVVVEAAAG
jgi:predicted ArsR family transcriptional regulator